MTVIRVFARGQCGRQEIARVFKKGRARTWSIVRHNGGQDKGAASLEVTKLMTASLARAWRMTDVTYEEGDDSLAWDRK